MKKNLIIPCSILLTCVAFFFGCKKEIKENQTTVTDTGLQLKGRQNGETHQCRLISNTSEFGQETFTYNQEGLLDEWSISGYGIFKQAYDSKKRLITSRFYSDNTLLYTINFSYSGGQIVKETWLNGNTDEIADEVFYNYNSRGQVIKAESFIGGYSVTTRYTQEGNVLKWLYSIGSTPFYSVQFTYLHRHKNPFSATPGLGYAYPFAGGAFYQNKWYSSSETDAIYDEDGNAIVIFDQDPNKTIVTTNCNDYVATSDFFDVLTQEYSHFRFEYENCCDNNNQSRNTKSPNISKVRKINPMSLFKRVAGKSIKEQVQEQANKLRQQLKNQ